MPRQRSVQRAGSGLRGADDQRIGTWSPGSHARDRRHDGPSLPPPFTMWALPPGGAAGRSVPLALRALEALLDLLLGLDDPGPGGAFDRLAGLQVLVDGEEVLDLQQQVLADVPDVAHVVASNIPGGYAEHLVVAARLVGHPEHR